MPQTVEANTFLEMRDEDEGEEEDLEMLENAIPEYFDFLAAYAATIPAQQSRRQPESEADSSGRKQYKKCYERRKHIVGFVARKFLTIDHIVKRSINSP